MTDEQDQILVDELHRMREAKAAGKDGSYERLRRLYSEKSITPIKAYLWKVRDGENTFVRELQEREYGQPIPDGYVIKSSPATFVLPARPGSGNVSIVRFVQHWEVEALEDPYTWDIDTGHGFGMMSVNFDSPEQIDRVIEDLKTQKARAFPDSPA